MTGLACGTEVVGGVFRPGPCDNELYSYEKWNIGFDAYWRFARGQRVGGGIEYLNQDRHRPDYDETEDTKLFLIRTDGRREWRQRINYTSRRD